MIFNSKQSQQDHNFVVRCIKSASKKQHYSQCRKIIRLFKLKYPKADTYPLFKDLLVKQINNL